MDIDEETVVKGNDFAAVFFLLCNIADFAV